MRFAFLDLQSRLDGLIAFLLHFQAVALRFEIVEAAGRLALAQDIARGAVQNGGRSYHVGNHLNRAAASGWNGMTAVVGSARRSGGRIVVFDVVDYVHAWRSVPQEFQELAMLGGTQLAGERQRVACSLDLCASCKSLFGDGLFDAAFVFRRSRSKRSLRPLRCGFFRRGIHGFRVACLIGSARCTFTRALRSLARGWSCSGIGSSGFRRWLRRVGLFDLLVMQGSRGLEDRLDLDCAVDDHRNKKQACKDRTHNAFSLWEWGRNRRDSSGAADDGSLSRRCGARG